MNTLVSLVHSFLGYYTPLCLDDGQPILGLAGVDFTYIFSGVLLCLTVWFFYKCILAIFRGVS